MYGAGSQSTHCTAGSDGPRDMPAQRDPARGPGSGESEARPPSQEQRQRERAERARQRGQGQQGFVGPWRNLRGNGCHRSVLGREEKKPD